MSQRSCSFLTTMLAVLLGLAVSAVAQKSSPTFMTLYNFSGNGQEGKGPAGGVVIGKGGVLYGTTYYGGISPGWGTVFQLNPPAQGGGPWTETQLYLFTNGSD